jgi:hypothetical protein
MTTPHHGTRRTATVSVALAAIIVLIAAGSGSTSSASSLKPTASGTTGVAGSSKGSCPPASKLAPIHGKYSPKIKPSNFVSKINDPYWPLKPGTTYHYKGVRGKTRQTDNETVTNNTKKILGVKSVVVRDTVSQHGMPIERTFDYYAQDKCGNAWYMGELSLQKNKQGKWVKASDSWLAGRNGGKPGIIVPGHPTPGESYRQEYYPPGKALDEATVVSLNGSVTVPYQGKHTGLLVTKERSPLEPQTEKKYYQPGLGEVKEKVVQGHHEVFRLVNVTHG